MIVIGLIRIHVLACHMQANCMALEDFHWFREMLFYACHHGEELPESDEDNLVLASVVEKVALPKLAGWSDGLCALLGVFCKF